MKLLKYTVMTLAVLFLAGCTVRYTTLHNVKDQSTVTKKGHHASRTKVRRAILASGADLGWQMKQLRPGYIVGTLHVRDHVAKVGIPYSRRSYSIRYISSKNLTRDGLIHKNYISWVNRLNQDIHQKIRQG